jgi:four helix bundle protein
MLEFASVVIDVTEKLPNTKAGNHIANQFLRAGTSPYGNHGEADLRNLCHRADQNQPPVGTSKPASLR